MADHKRLDHAIEGRAIDLGLSFVELAERAGISDVTLRNFRKGRGNLRLRNQRKLENALGWAAGSIASILDGGAAVLAGTEPEAAAPPMPSEPDEIRREIEDLEDEIEHLEVRYERNRQLIVEHLRRRLTTLRARLNSPSEGG